MSKNGHKTAQPERSLDVFTADMAGDTTAMSRITAATA
jgi:hypothetical protein